MLILALDTSSAAGSAAIVRGDAIVRERAGDAARTHGERLPRELMALLDDARVALDAIDAFAIVTGPGSFTGLRIGIATIQGLALAQGKLVVPISTFEALAFAPSAPSASVSFPASNLQPPASAPFPSSVLRPPTSAGATVDEPSSAAIAVWIDAHRGEVFATLYAADGATVLQPPTSLPPDATLDAWSDSLGAAPAIRFAGDGAIRYRAAIDARLGGRAEIPAAAPLLAGTVGRRAAREPGRAVRPHAVVPLYVRRSDAELARDRPRPAGGA
jgi:tRNA threonylcarbamoyladenosine biosynthesis protein TsaB